MFSDHRQRTYEPDEDRIREAVRILSRGKRATVGKGRMIVGCYARVSTEEQRERQTIDAQVDHGKGRASLEGWNLRLFLE